MLKKYEYACIANQGKEVLFALQRLKIVVATLNNEFRIEITYKGLNNIKELCSIIDSAYSP